MTDSIPRGWAKQYSLIIILSLGMDLFAGPILARPNSSRPTPVQIGSWRTLDYLMPINPIHCGVTHTGKQLIGAGSEYDDDELNYGISRAS
jgi:hypothetical protein